MGAIRNLLYASVFGSEDCRADEPARCWAGHPDNSSHSSHVQLTGLFRRPLVIGASVSADYFTQNPVTRAIRLLGVGAHPRVRAKFGATGRSLVRALGPADLRDCSLVVGIDLFFWDTLYPPYQESERAIQRICQVTSVENAPLLLGTAPLLSFSWLQPGLRLLNEAVREASHRFPHCRVLDLERIYVEIQRKGGFSVHGRRFGLDKVSPDGLHLSSAACEFLALQMLSVLKGDVMSQMKRPGLHEVAQP